MYDNSSFCHVTFVNIFIFLFQLLLLWIFNLVLITIVNWIVHLPQGLKSINCQLSLSLCPSRTAFLFHANIHRMELYVKRSNQTLELENWNYICLYRTNKKQKRKKEGAIKKAWAKIWRYTLVTQRSLLSIGGRQTVIHGCARFSQRHFKLASATW